MAEPGAEPLRPREPPTVGVELGGESAARGLRRPDRISCSRERGASILVEDCDGVGVSLRQTRQREVVVGDRPQLSEPRHRSTATGWRRLERRVDECVEASAEVVGSHAPSASEMSRRSLLNPPSGPALHSGRGRHPHVGRRDRWPNGGADRVPQRVILGRADALPSVHCVVCIGAHTEIGAVHVGVRTTRIPAVVARESLLEILARLLEPDDPGDRGHAAVGMAQLRCDPVRRNGGVSVGVGDPDRRQRTTAASAARCALRLVARRRG